MHPLQRLLERTDLVCRSYSGRGMFGGTCLGVTIRSMGSFLSSLIEACLRDNGAETAAEADEVCLALRSCCQDSMGLDLVLYFPRVPYTDPRAETKR